METRIHDKNGCENPKHMKLAYLYEQHSKSQERCVRFGRRMTFESVAPLLSTIQRRRRCLHAQTAPISSF